MYTTRNIIIFFAVLGLFACGQKNPAPDRPADKAPGQVQLNPEQVRNADLRSGYTDTVEISSEILLNGVVEAPPSHRISLSFPLGAVVKNIRVLPGEKVQRGQSLFRLESVQIADMQRSFLSARALCTQLEAELARQDEMLRNNASSEKQYLDVQTRLLVEEASREALKQQLELLGIHTGQLSATAIRPYVDVQAPASGYITEVPVNEGMYIDAGKEIMVMINPDDIHISLQAFEEHIPYLHEKQRVSFFVNNSPEHIFGGTIIGISRQIGADRSFQVHCHIDRNEMNRPLMPGMFINGRVKINGGRVAALPAGALVRVGEQLLAYSDEGNGLYTEHQLQTGLSDDSYTQVILPGELQHKKWVRFNAYTVWLSLHNAADQE